MSDDVLVGVVPITDDNREQLTRLAVVMHISGRKCPVCDHEYTSYEDIKSRSPKHGGEDAYAVCKDCWDEYVNTLSQTITKEEN